MTEHKKIPVPGKDKEGNSLLERSVGAFGLGGLKSAPVPKDLAPGKPKRKTAKKSPPKPFAPEVAVQPNENVPEQEAAAAATPVEPVTFTQKAQSVDRDALSENGFIVPDSGVSALMEEFRIVKREVLQTVRDARGKGMGAKAQRVLVCSPLPGEGKTFCSTNLALALAAEKDGEVILVDADFAKPSILSTLGLQGGGKGLMDALANPKIDIEDTVIPTDIRGLHVIPAGNQTASDSEYLSSARTSGVLDRLVQGAPNRIVIFDSPPALAASPAGELAKHVGQALVIARADKTGQSALDDALNLLDDCEDIRLILNDATFSPSGRRFGTYYGYGG